MELTPSVRDRLKGARELARAHQATIRAGEAILAALDVLFPDDDDEPVSGEGQVAADLAEAEAHLETAEILSDPDTMAALREAEAEAVDYGASSAGQSTPPAARCFVCLDVPRREAFAQMMGLCYRHADGMCQELLAAENERDRLRESSIRDLAELRDRQSELARENVRLAAVAHEQGVDLARLREAVRAARSVLADAP